MEALVEKLCNRFTGVSGITYIIIIGDYANSNDHKFHHMCNEVLSVLLLNQ